MVVRVVLHHGRQAEGVRQRARHGRTDQALSIGCHEIDVFRGGEFRRADQVALVFAVRVVNDEHHLARSQVAERLLNQIVHCVSLLKIRIRSVPEIPW